MGVFALLPLSVGALLLLVLGVMAGPRLRRPVLPAMERLGSVLHRWAVGGLVHSRGIPLYYTVPLVVVEVREKALLARCFFDRMLLTPTAVRSIERLPGEFGGPCSRVAIDTDLGRLELFLSDLQERVLRRWVARGCELDGGPYRGCAELPAARSFPPAA